MSYKLDLTRGPIALQLTKVSLPIMLTMFIQMTYVLVDMIWIGRLGSGAIAAIGSAGFYTWLGMAVAFLPKVGLEVNVAQTAGRNNIEALKNFIVNGLLLTFVVALVYSVVVFTFAPSLIGFFKLGTDVNSFNPTSNAIIYIRILAVGMILQFFNLSCTSVYNGLGKSKLPFYYNSAGLILNVVLDPVLIYGLWFIPRLEVAGAAIATLISHGTVATLFIFSFKRNFDFFDSLKCFLQVKKEYCRKIIKIGLPPAIQGVFFASIGIVLARIISQWGPIPIAVQRIGAQIESLSWMTAQGFSTALSAFVGQNHGAGQDKRVWKGYLTAMYIMSTIGVLVSLLLVLFPEFLFKIFVKEEETIRQGVIYLVILSCSQLFMCLEMTTAGAFNGLGKTIPPTIVGICGNLIRIPAALVLSGMIGLSGVWWSISGSSIVKGVVLVVWFVWYFKRIKKISHNISA